MVADDLLTRREEPLRRPCPYTLPADEAGYGWGATSPAAYAEFYLSMPCEGEGPPPCLQLRRSIFS